MSARAAPELLYDGTCEFCRYWVRYWKRLTGTRVVYRPYQQALAEFPNLNESECQRAVQLLEPDGSRLSGARASFRVLCHGGYPLADRLLRGNRVLTELAERTYTAISRRRQFAHTAAHALWGPERYPATYMRASTLFVRVIAVVYLIAFASLGVQIEALVGRNGILPAELFFDAVEAALPHNAWQQVPTLFWLSDTDTMLVGACVAGALAAVAAAFGLWPGVMLLGCYGLYLSLFYAGQDFLSFQWDLLLLEAGFLAIFLPLRTRVVPSLFRLLLFKFMFLSGCVKLLSGDSSWMALSALEFHYETQPLPTPLAWYVHQLPAWFDRLCVTGTFVVELALPLFIFAPRRPRMIAAAGFIGLEIVIALTGNYNFFNFLTIALCLFLFDDAQFGRRDAPAPQPPRRRVPVRVALGLLVAVVVAHNIYYLWRPFASAPNSGPLASFVAPLAPLRAVNGYGLFAVMTTSRPEIIVQGSNDGSTWLDYAFQYKPGDPARGPNWNVPHQPRLDWQMWFAALSGAERAPWFASFLARLLNNAPEVTALLRYNPFPDSAPRYVRALLYDYRFTSRAERAASGQAWKRRPTGLYYPAIRLR